MQTKNIPNYEHRWSRPTRAGLLAVLIVLGNAILMRLFLTAPAIGKAFLILNPWVKISIILVFNLVILTSEIAILFPEAFNK